MSRADRQDEIADVIARLEDCLVRLDALGCQQAARRVDHAIEDLRSASAPRRSGQPKQPRPA